MSTPMTVLWAKTWHQTRTQLQCKPRYLHNRQSVGQVSQSIHAHTILYLHHTTKDNWNKTLRRQFALFS